MRRARRRRVLKVLRLTLWYVPSAPSVLHYNDSRRLSSGRDAA